jgi:hypothetical protein
VRSTSDSKRSRWRRGSRASLCRSRRTSRPRRIAFLSDAPALRERQTDNLTEKSVRPYTFTVTNKDFSAVLPVRSADWRRAKTDQIMIRARELGARAAQLPQSVLLEAAEHERERL